MKRKRFTEEQIAFALRPVAIVGDDRLDRDVSRQWALARCVDQLLRDRFADR